MVRERIPWGFLPNNFCIRRGRTEYWETVPMTKRVERVVRQDGKYACNVECVRRTDSRTRSAEPQQIGTGNPRFPSNPLASRASRYQILSVFWARIYTRTSNLYIYSLSSRPHVVRTSFRALDLAALRVVGLTGGLTQHTCKVLVI